MALSLTDKSINKYLRFLSFLDTPSKKKVILSLVESIEIKNNESKKVDNLFGAWEDTKNSDEIISQIKKVQN